MLQIGYFLFIITASVMPFSYPRGKSCAWICPISNRFYKTPNHCN
nr:MAG TPA: Exopolysaccharide production repressor [Caudoviricetes sp.]